MSRYGGGRGSVRARLLARALFRLMRIAAQLITIFILLSLPSTSVTTQAGTKTGVLPSTVNPFQTACDAEYAAHAGRGQLYQRHENGIVCWGAGGICLAKSDDDDKMYRIPGFNLRLPTCRGVAKSSIHEERISHGAYSARNEDKVDAPLPSKWMQGLSQEDQRITKKGADSSLVQTVVMPNPLVVTRAKVALAAAVTMVVAAVSPAMMAPVARMACPPGYLCGLWGPKPSRRAPRLREKRQPTLGRAQQGPRRGVAGKGLVRQNSSCVESGVVIEGKGKTGGKTGHGRDQGTRGAAVLDAGTAPQIGRRQARDPSKTTETLCEQTGAAGVGRDALRRGAQAAKPGKIKKSSWSSWPCRWSEGCTRRPLFGTRPWTPLYCSLHKQVPTSLFPFSAFCCTEIGAGYAEKFDGVGRGRRSIIATWQRAPASQQKVALARFKDHSTPCPFHLQP